MIAASLALLAMLDAPVGAQPRDNAAPSPAKPAESSAPPSTVKPAENAPPPAPIRPADKAPPPLPKPPESAASPPAPKPAESVVPPTPAKPPESVAAPRLPPPPESPFAELFSQLAGRVLGVVVNISTEAAPPTAKTAQEVPQNSPGTTLDEVFRDFFGEKGAPGGSGAPIASLGSGFIIDPTGLIVTNNHVIANAEQITVTLSDNTELQAHVVGRDAVTDLALLRVDAKTPLPAATWGDSNKAKVGDWVLAIGNPFGLGGTVTAGIISATARDIHSSPYDDYLQTDASINRGNSGGPMFDLSGAVIGINTVIYSPSGGSIGIGFAIPSALAEPIIEQLKATGKVERGWIGARIQPVTDDIAESVGLDKSRGAMIAAIDQDSPAAQAKLQPGDVILSYDGTAIERSRQLPRLVAATPPDKKVKLAVWRDGKETEFELKAAALNPNRPPPPPRPPEKPKPPVTVDALGLKLAKLSPELSKQFSLPDGARGAVITEVPPNSAAAAQDLRPGDLLIAIGHAKVTGPEEVPQIAAAAKKAGRKKVLVRVERAGNTRFVALPVEATS
ncbi:MAG TPA: Do family serine endopeptidase [Stellaceae bacterium]|nr:Do family serine endopeptidase [Stellaceae bacterium]